MVDASYAVTEKLTHFFTLQGSDQGTNVGFNSWAAKLTFATRLQDLGITPSDSSTSWDRVSKSSPSSTRAPLPPKQFSPASEIRSSFPPTPTPGSAPISKTLSRR